MRKIPFSPPDLSQAEIDEVIKVLKSGWITTGPETKLFESRIAERCHTEKAVCLSSQTSCAELTLRILGIGPGDEVIVPAYTYTATASIIYHVGAKLLWLTAKAAASRWTTIKWRRQSTTIQRLSFLLTLQVLCATMTVF